MYGCSQARLRSKCLPTLNIPAGKETSPKSALLRPFHSDGFFKEVTDDLIRFWDALKREEGRTKLRESRAVKLAGQDGEIS